MDLSNKEYTLISETSQKHEIETIFKWYIKPSFYRDVQIPRTELKIRREGEDF